MVATGLKVADMEIQPFSELVASLYDCAIDPELWPEVLVRIRKSLGFHFATLSLMDLTTGAVPLALTSGIEEPWLGRLGRYNDEIIAAWGGMESLQGARLDEPRVLSWINPVACTRASRYHLEWSQPQDIIDVMALTLARDSGAIGKLGLGRHAERGPITHRDVAIATALLPHLHRTFAISRLLEVRQASAQPFETIVDRIATPVVTVAADARLIWANRSAQALISARDTLLLCNGRIGFRAQGADRSVAAALRRLRDGEARLDGMGLDVPLRESDGGPLGIHVLPLKSGTLRTAHLPGAIAAIFLSPWKRQREVPDMLMALFGLTPAEGRVLELAARGCPPATIASELGSALSTVRTHLLRLYEKTGVHGRAELVALAASFSGPLHLT